MAILGFTIHGESSWTLAFLATRKYLSAFPTGRVIARAMLNGLADILCFFVVMVVLLLGYVAMGHTIFGTIMVDFSTLGYSVARLICGLDVFEHRVSDRSHLYTQSIQLCDLASFFQHNLLPLFPIPRDSNTAQARWLPASRCSWEPSEASQRCDRPIVLPTTSIGTPTWCSSVTWIILERSVEIWACLIDPNWEIWEALKPSIVWKCLEPHFHLLSLFRLWLYTIVGQACVFFIPGV